MPGDKHYPPVADIWHTRRAAAEQAGRRAARRAGNRRPRLEEGAALRRCQRDRRHPSNAATLPADFGVKHTDLTTWRRSYRLDVRHFRVIISRLPSTTSIAIHQSESNKIWLQFGRNKENAVNFFWCLKNFKTRKTDLPITQRFPTLFASRLQNGPKNFPRPQLHPEWMFATPRDPKIFLTR